MAVAVVVNSMFFLGGLSIGIVLLYWQRSRSKRGIKSILRHWPANNGQTSLSLNSHLSVVVASQQQQHYLLEQQLELYRQVLYSAPIGYLQVDDENRLIWCNAQARQLLGIYQEQYPKLRLLLEVVRSYELDQLIEQTRNAKVARQNDWTFYPVSSDASQLSKQHPYAIRGYGIPLTGGQVGIFLENRQETVTLLQQRDRWTSDVAHELKTPLTSIRLVAETLQSRLELPLRGWVDRLVSETMRLSTMVQDLLDLSQIQQGAPHCLQLKAIDLVELIHSAWLNLEPLARKKQVQLDYQGTNHLVIQADEPRLYRVLINLLDNGIKYSPPWEELQVKLSIQPGSSSSGQFPQEQYVLLEVIDAGSGFADHDLPHVFERFYRADPARARQMPSGQTNLTPTANFAPTEIHPAEPRTTELRVEHERFEPHYRSGSGLGLAIVKQIVEAHQGMVMAANHPATGGAWLQVYFPLLHQGQDGEKSENVFPKN